MKTQKIFSRVLDGMILTAFLLFFSSAGFQDISTSGWYQQWLPNLNGSTIKDITFLDSLTGFAVTNTNSSLQAYILKTTNGGDNWNINYTYSQSNANWYFVKIGFVDSNTGYAFGWSEMFKTTNGGTNWNMIINNLYANDIAIINKDTMLASLNNGFDGGVYRSINGGLSWTRIWTNGTAGNPDKIYMFDKNIGFSCVLSTISELRKTSNGGFNWFDINISDAFLDIKLLDTLTGWKGTNSIQKTTDGGITWFLQTPPNVYSFIVRSISIINKDSVWLGGDAFKIIGNTYYGALCKTTNGGTNWGYQIPNMAVDSGMYEKVDFINKNNGWAYINSTPGFNDGVHTKVGGHDTTIYTGINNNINFISSDYQLFQNYPNPFNATSNIKYKILKSSDVRIEVMNILGTNILTLVNKKQSPGNYGINFNGENLGSGIYFYSMIIDGKVVDTKRMILLK